MFSLTKIKRKRAIKKLERKTSSIISLRCTFNKSTFLEGKNKIGVADISSSRIGYGSYIVSGMLNNCNIGRFTSIGSNVNVLAATHPTTFVSTFPGFYNTKNKGIFKTVNDIHFNENKTCSNGFFVNIGSDVWIGNNVAIIGGISIGDGSIIGANALITKDVPPYAIVGGVPAKVIKYRFSKDQIKKLNQIKWWNWDIDKIAERSKLFDDLDGFFNSCNEEKN